MVNKKIIVGIIGLLIIFGISFLFSNLFTILNTVNVQGYQYTDKPVIIISNFEPKVRGARWSSIGDDLYFNGGYNNLIYQREVNFGNYKIVDDGSRDVYRNWVQIYKEGVLVFDEFEGADVNRPKTYNDGAIEIRLRTEWIGGNAVGNQINFLFPGNLFDVNISIPQSFSSAEILEMQYIIQNNWQEVKVNISVDVEIKTELATLTATKSQITILNKGLNTVKFQLPSEGINANIKVVPSIRFYEDINKFSGFNVNSCNFDIGLPRIAISKCNSFTYGNYKGEPVIISYVNNNVEKIVSPNIMIPDINSSAPQELVQKINEYGGGNINGNIVLPVVITPVKEVVNRFSDVFDGSVTSGKSDNSILNIIMFASLGVLMFVGVVLLLFYYIGRRMK